MVGSRRGSCKDSPGVTCTGIAKEEKLRGRCCGAAGEQWERRKAEECLVPLVCTEEFPLAFLGRSWTLSSSS